MIEPPRDQRAESIDISHALRVLAERKWVIIVLVLLALGGAIVQSRRTTPLYHATSEILARNTSLDEALFNAQIFQVTDQVRTLNTGADLVKLDQVAEKVKAELGSSRSIGSLQNMVKVSPNSSADIIDIVATSSDASEPAKVADSFAKQFILYRQQTDRAVLADARAQVEAKLQAMTPAEVASARGQTLSQKVEELTVLESMQTGGYELVQAATTPTSPFNLHTTRNVAVGLVVGLVLGLIIASFLHVLDKRIKDEDAFEKEFGAPIIARIPLVGRRWSGRRGARSNAPVGFANEGGLVLEAFRTLRSNLKFFEVDRKLSTILVTSALPREGKSVTAINLALSLAMSGSRVILLEADLRRPMLQKYLGLDGRRGFTDLLSGTLTVSEAVQVVETSRLLPDRHDNELISESNGKPTVKRDLLFVAAGPLPPNPAELLGTNRMFDVMNQLTAVCDHVVVDAPPVLLVADALEIAKKVDGVILVARIRATRFDEARRTHQSLERIGVKPLGVVVCGLARAKAYYRRYGGYYAKA